MSAEKQREIASKGGRAAHEKGTAHEWTADEARNAGRKGGQVSRGGRGRLIRGGERPRPERFFRDVHGTEFHRQPNVVVHGGGNATGDDDVQRRHWTVVCADRRGPR